VLAAEGPPHSTLKVYLVGWSYSSDTLQKVLALEVALEVRASTCRCCDCKTSRYAVGGASVYYRCKRAGVGSDQLLDYVVSWSRVG
jgi:hypothetical protein